MGVDFGEDLALIDAGDVSVLFSLGAVLGSINPIIKSAAKIKKTAS